MKWGDDYLVEYILFFVVLTVCLVLVTLMSGCTAASYERDAAQVAAAKGCYCAATECKQVVSAVGAAATVAAERENLRAVQVTRK